MDGQVTFADIELFVELSIKVYNQKTELLENADGKIIVPNGLRKVDLFFDLPEGSLKVYDLDGVSISGSNGKSPSNPFGELDSNPFGTVDYHKTIGNLLINRNSNPIYQDGHCYLFVYEFEGLTAQKTICFEAPELQPPTIELLDSNEVMLEEPFVLDVNNERKKYAVRFYPKDSVATVWVFVEGVKKVIETMTIPSDDHVEDIEVQDLYKNYGKGPFFIENKNAVGEVLTQFTLNYKTDKRIPELTLLANGEELIDEPFLLDPRKAEYALKVNEVGGSLRLTSVEGIVILEIDVVEHLETYLDLFEMGKLSKGAPIHAVYIVEDNADELEFSITMIHDPEPLTLTIFNSGTEKQVDSKDGIYDLVFDYKNPKQYFEFKFSKGPGTIKMMDEKGEEYSISVESDYSRFNGVDKLPIGLTSGDYECTYQSENDDAIEFRLNVINLNPTFILTDIGYERPNYLATAVPVNAKAQAYIWRVDGEYVSRAKEPVLELNFGRGKTLEIELTLHLEDYESNYSIKLNRNDIKKMRDEQ